MSIAALPTDASRAMDLGSAPDAALLSMAVESLRRGFGREVSLVSMADGRLLHASPAQPNGDTPARLRIVHTAPSSRSTDLQVRECPAWASPLTTQIESHGPLLVLVAPLDLPGLTNVAVWGVFVERDLHPADDLSSMTAWLDADSPRLAEWMARQPRWTAEGLRRVVDLVRESLAGDQQRQSLQRESHQLTESLAESYEQLSLLYSVAERVRDSHSVEELVASILEWLLEALPAAQTIMSLNPGPGVECRFFSAGEQALSRGDWMALLNHLQPRLGARPYVMNVGAEHTDWPFPKARQVVLAPLRVEHGNVGWLAAINHARGGWFGTSQGRLLNGLATIAGMRVLLQEIAALRRTAELAHAAKSNFLAGVSHEFRTPLHGIISFTRLLLDGVEGDEEERRDWLATIDGCAARILELVNDLLEFSQLESEELHVERVPCTLNDVLTSAVTELQPRAAAKGLLLDVTGVGAAFAMVHTDPTRLRQILTILLRNAIKFTERGSVRVATRVQTDVASHTDAADAPSATKEPPASPRESLVIEVSDTGMGIPPDKLEVIFEPFVQADGSKTRKHGGIGLGLAISRRIARLLGGDLTARSELGKGSTFTLTLGADSIVENATVNRDLDLP